MVAGSLKWKIEQENDGLERRWVEEMAHLTQEESLEDSVSVD